MSDEPKPGKARGGVIPPELQPYLGKRRWPKAQKLGEDPGLDAAAAAYRALDEPAGEEEPPVQDLSIGMGNASAYAGPTELKPAKLPAAERGPAAAASPKVELAMAEVPRALPAGSPTRETVETRILRRPSGEEDEATLQRGHGGRTVGGGTERLPVASVASPWAKDATVPPVVPVELPSSHGPAPAPASPSGPAARRSAVGLALAAILVGVAAFAVLRMAVTKPEGDAHPGSDVAPTPHSVPSATPTMPPSGSTAPSTTVPSAVPAPPSPASTVVPAPSAVPTVKPAGRPRPARSDDPYDGPPLTPSAAAVAPPPVATAVPAVPPAVAPKPTATPTPDDGDLMYHHSPR